MTPLSDRDRTIRDMRRRGETVRQIAKDVGLSPGQVSRICKESGWTPPTSNRGWFEWTRERKALLEQMVMERRSRKFMVARLGCSMKQLRYRIDKLGLVKERTRREAQAALDKAYGRLPRVPGAARMPKDRRPIRTSSEMTTRLIRTLAAKGWPAIDIARQARCEVEEVEAELA